MGKAFVIAATHSGAGKSLITMALLRHFYNQGIKVAAAKTGPDYIDPTFHAKAINSHCYNYDLWAMNEASLNLVEADLANADLAIIEGVLGLFDGPIKGIGSTADIAQRLNLPVVLVVDAGAMAQSVAALIFGFANFRPDINLAAVIFNNVGSPRHVKMLKDAVKPLNIPVLGCLPRNKAMRLPSRHLGLVQADEMLEFEAFIEQTSSFIENHLDLSLLASMASNMANKPSNMANKPSNMANKQRDEKKLLPPLGQKIAIAKDAAFTFIYPHMVNQWRKMGAEISFFSPLNDQLPALDVDAVFLPGGYPELHAGMLASKNKLRANLQYLASKNTLIYGECGGFMTMGNGLVDKDGKRHQMFNLLDLETSFEHPKRHLGYRKLTHDSQLPWAKTLMGHEFHYTHAVKAKGEPLFKAKDAQNVELATMGLKNNHIMGSYAHIIDVVN